MQDLSGKRIVLGLSGGIACYKSAELVRRLQDQGATVDVVMTQAATHFITPVTMQALSGRPVFIDAWDARIPNNMAHINLTRGADAILVAPASANFMSRLARGAADDLLATLCLARSCPLLVAPAMNREMWDNPATQRNVAQLREDGITVLGPGSGDQACGETGDGRMLEAHELVADLIAFFQPKVLAGQRVLITAGPTSEHIDPVRVLTNLSSGKMGYAIARAAADAGAQVTLVSGPTALPTPRGVTRVDVRSAHDMLHAVLTDFDRSDVFVAVAAVADWHIKNAGQLKIKKEKGAPPPVLELVDNPDILATVAARPAPQGQRAPYCVGFAAETHELHLNAADKRRRKGVPLLVGNLAQHTLGTDDVELVLFDEAGHYALARQSKLLAARALVTEIARRQAKPPIGLP